MWLRCKRSCQEIWIRIKRPSSCYSQNSKRVNAIAAISTNGLLALNLTCHTVNHEIFFDFVRSTLIPKMVFNGTNPHSIVVMDNLSVHRVREIVELFKTSGILVLLLPPYSPDLNPIEEAFSYIKSYLREHELLLECLSNPNHVITAAFNSITPLQCQSWITNSGY